VATLPTDIPLLSLRELVRTFGAGAALSRNGCFSTGNYVQMGVKSLMATI